MKSRSLVIDALWSSIGPLCYENPDKARLLCNDELKDFMQFCFIFFLCIAICHQIMNLNSIVFYIEMIQMPTSTDLSNAWYKIIEWIFKLSETEKIGLTLPMTLSNSVGLTQIIRWTKSLSSKVWIPRWFLLSKLFCLSIIFLDLTY